MNRSEAKDIALGLTLRAIEREREEVLNRFPKLRGQEVAMIKAELFRLRLAVEKLNNASDRTKPV